ncbi:hydrophobic/amphiphilic exporter-1, HAE1 family [Alteribacillus persepolensis]|uniref:Hydrophobic/amphiphilic exporter-1, HAE1 family n=1 Tax=Alteribacillus persepolensis TaxID=568899 RepID=A0A1G8FK14_9BACI|nr:efflux RND transporter permease subunit [Alteribacillus persepolensis]SDH82455.1 hydrophobic/amphiphilic exporter-1, HAE1 family [Alteribacillus persepolensis]
MKLTNVSIRRPKLTIVGMILFILLGGVSLTNLPLQLFPEINPPVGAVVSSYPGASPEEVEDKVTKPLEEELSTLPGLSTMTSTSEEGMALVLLEFSWDSTIDEVEQDIITSMNQANISDDANSPSFLKFDPSMMGMAQMAVTSNNQDVQGFQGDVDEFQTELERIDGIANVDTSGQVTEQFEVRLDQEELEANQLTQEEIVQTIQSHNLTLPGGTVETGDRQLTTRAISSLSGEEDLANIVIGANPQNGEELVLSDIAEVAETTGETDAITRANQQPALQMTVIKETDANTAQVSQAFNDEMETLLGEEEYDHLSVVSFYDEGEYIQLSINSVSQALVLGGIFAMAVLFFFLRNWKTPLIIGTAIPFSVIVTFGFLYFTDVSLNLMTLGGLALGIGMLVDNAIVVIENIYRHLSMGKTAKEAAAEGTKEVGGAITASTLTTVSVFLPIVFISGIVGNIFTEFALAVAFSLLASLLVAVTVVPMMSSRMLTAPRGNQERKRQNSAFMKGIGRSISWVLGHRFMTLFITFVLLAVGGAGIAATGINFLPATDEGYFMVDIEMEHGTNLDKTAEVVEGIEEILDDESVVADYMSVVGSSEDTAGMGGPSGSHEAQMFVTMTDLQDRNQSTIDFVEDIEGDVQGVDQNADISLSTQAAVGGGEANSIVFTMSDNDTAALEEAVAEVEEELNNERYVRSVETSMEERAPELQVRIDEEAARNNGFAPAQVAETVHQVTRGETATSIQTDSNENYDVVVQYSDESLADKEDLETLLIPNDEGEYIELNDLAVVDEAEGPAVINRLDQERSVEFTVSYTSDTNLNDMSNLIENIIEEADIQDSTSYAFSGEQELLEDALNSLVFAFILALLFIYLVMAGQFESFKYPFVVMFSVPLVIIGVMLALTITQTPLSVTVFIGLIVLAGIVVNNAIVLVDYINQSKERGLPTREAIIEGVKKRTRPILMTAITTILGVVPLALGMGEGTEIQQPMGIAVIGGLISSTFLTLFVIPVLYSFMDKDTRHMNKRYVTPQGRVIYAYELDEDDERRQTHTRLLTSEPQNDSSIQETEQPLDENSQEQRNEAEESKNEATRENKEIDSLTKDDILHLLENIVQKSKHDDQDKDDKNKGHHDNNNES